MADNVEKIEDLEELIDLGATEIENDGTRVKIDPAAAARRLRELQRQDDNFGDPRPPFLTVDFSGL